MCVCVLVRSSECFIFVEDFHPSRTPASGGKKFYLTNEEPATSFGKGKNESRWQHRLVSSDELQ